MQTCQLILITVRGKSNQLSLHWLTKMQTSDQQRSEFKTPFLPILYDRFGVWGNRQWFTYVLSNCPTLSLILTYVFAYTLYVQWFRSEKRDGFHKKSSNSKAWLRLLIFIHFGRSVKPNLSTNLMVPFIESAPNKYMFTVVCSFSEIVEFEFPLLSRFITLIKRLAQVILDILVGKSS